MEKIDYLIDGIKDLYTSAFYPFRTEEEKWAYLNLVLDLIHLE